MIRIASAADRAALENIYDVCFPGEPDFRQWFFDRIYRPENTLVWEDENGLCAAVQLLPVEISAGEKRLAATYIYAAGTLPAFRGRGLMAKLLERSFEMSAARGDRLSVLIVQEPRLFEYYSRFGYRPVFVRRQCSIGAAPLPDGLTVSKLETCHFEQAEQLPVTMEHSELSARVGEEGTLTLTYTDKVDVYTKLTSREKLTYEAFAVLVNEEAFLYGTPIEGSVEMLQGESYAPLTGNEEEIADGTYRIAYTVSNGEIKKSGYLYLSYACLPEGEADNVTE